MRAKVTIVPQRTIANLTVDFHGIALEFTHVDITTLDTIWVAMDSDGTVTAFDAEPVPSTGRGPGFWDAAGIYNEDTGIAFLAQESEEEPVVLQDVAWEDSLVEYKVK